MSCEHTELNVTGKAQQAQSGDQYAAAIVVHCAQCGERFGFRGVPCGVSPHAPVRALDGRMVILPLLTPEELDEMGENAGAMDDPAFDDDSARVPGWKEPAADVDASEPPKSAW